VLVPPQPLPRRFLQVSPKPMVFPPALHFTVSVPLEGAVGWPPRAMPFIRDPHRISSGPHMAADHCRVVTQCQV
jgi:hypothetical protein